MPEKTRVAILGGGASGLAAAFELSRTEELQATYDVTVYETSWRLGGKGASGRRAGAGQRIEEHGLHIWFGFYDNAFDVMRQTYEALNRPASHPLATLEKAFEPLDEVVLYNRTPDGSWQPRRWRFPPADGRPGDFVDEDTYYSLPDIFRRALAWAESHRPQAQPGVQPHPKEQEFDTAISQLIDVLDTIDKHGLGHSILGRMATTAIAEALDALAGIAWQLAKALPHWHEHAMLMDLFTTVLKGVVEDGLYEDGASHLNDTELSQWLHDHGAQPETVEHCAALRAFYDLCFAYADGRRDQRALAAGKALQAMLRLAGTYKRAVMFKMAAGMGDAVFAPLYELLDSRGVRFEFFHRVTDIGVDPDSRLVDRIELARLARPRPGWKPLVRVAGVDCWPSEPAWEDLEDGVALKAAGMSFERPSEEAIGRADSITLTDFDEVVLAIPVVALREICPDVARHSERFAQMLDRIPSVATQAAQVWLKSPPAELGWRFEGSSVAGAYRKPLDTYCDMTHLIEREAWPPGEVGAIAYFCGVMEEDYEDADDADARAKQDGIEHLAGHAAALWPAVCSDGGFDWSCLVDPDDREGVERFDAQFWRANTFGSERYVLTPAGSVKFRLKPDESGYDNLRLAGDWTRNGICGGSVEAAVTSGRLAAHHILGDPESVHGLRGWLVEDEELNQ